MTTRPAFPNAGYSGALNERPIPRTGEMLPVIGLGTWQAFDVGGDPSEITRATDAVRALVDGGGTLVDSSPMYGTAESVVGLAVTALGAQRKAFLATKVWTSGREPGLRQMEQSIVRMQGTRAGAAREVPLDLMQVHNLVDADTHLATLTQWKREGRVRYIGITHYTAAAHLSLARYLKRGDIDFVQANYSIAEPEAARGLLAAVADAGAAFIVNRPFAEGELLARVRGRAVPSWAAELGCTSWAQLCLKWILAEPAVTCVIPGTRNPRHVVDNLAAGRGLLPDESMRRRIADAVGP